MSKHRFKRSFRAGGAAAVLRGLLFSMAVTLVLTLLFALLIGWTDMSDTAIRLINQVIKIGAIVFGACFSIPRGDERALRRGALIGFIYMALGVLLYALLSAQKLTPAQYLTDVFLGVAVGGLTGVVLNALHAKEA